MQIANHGGRDSKHEYHVAIRQKSILKDIKFVNSRVESVLAHIHEPLGILNGLQVEAVCWTLVYTLDFFMTSGISIIDGSVQVGSEHNEAEENSIDNI